MIARNGFAFLVVVLSVAPSFALAADLDPYQPPQSDTYIPAEPAPMMDAPRRYNWTGLYWGLNGGYGWGETANAFGGANTEYEGGLGAATLGYNLQLPGGLLIGLEGDVGLMDLSAEELGRDRHEVGYGLWWGTLRGRAGLTFNRTLLYGTAGLAFAEVDGVSFGNEKTSWDDNFKTGWAIGGGIEHAISSNVSLKLEYLHMDFGDYESSSSDRHAYSLDSDVDVVRAGINFKF